MNQWTVWKSLHLEMLAVVSNTLLIAVGFFAMAIVIYEAVVIVRRWQKNPKTPSTEEADKNPPIVSEECEDDPEQAKTILIADDDPVIVLALSQRLRRLGYKIFHTPDATNTLLEIKKIHPDLVILDIQMPSGNGLAVCEMLACDRECVNIPIIVHSAFTDESVKRSCRQLRTHYVAKSSHSWEDIKALVESLLGEGETADREPPPDTDEQRPENFSWETTVSSNRQLHSVLCIDDDPVIVRSIAIRLQIYGIRAKGIDNGEQGYLQAAADPPDLILLDLKMPTGAGNQVLGKLKGDPRTKDIPVIVLTMESTIGVQRLMSSLGASGFLTKPVHWPKLFAEMERCVQLPQQLLIDYNLLEPLAAAGR